MEWWSEATWQVECALHWIAEAGWPGQMVFAISAIGHAVIGAVFLGRRRRIGALLCVATVTLVAVLAAGVSAQIIGWQQALVPVCGIDYRELLVNASEEISRSGRIALLGSIVPLCVATASAVRLRRSLSR